MSTTLTPVHVLASWIDDPDPALLNPCALRLARRIPELQDPLDRVLETPLDRALAGLGPAPDPAAEGDIGRAILAAQALVAGGGDLPVALAAQLEQRAEGDPRWWVPAARLHVNVSRARTQQARMALSEMDMPYVFPGDLHTLAVELLAVGDRVLQAHHVDWVRKLTKWVADFVVLDLRAMGLWFWPHLRFLSEKQLERPLRRAMRAKRLPPGGRGLGLGYLCRTSGKGFEQLEGLGPADRFMAAVSIRGDQLR